MEIIERMRRSGSQLWAIPGDDEWLRRGSDLLDVAEAVELLRNKGGDSKDPWWEMEYECIGCERWAYKGEHGDDCPVPMLDRALDSFLR